jgi:FKBP-type peptidyl-prolyl cis-trans isomerase FklB
LRGSKVKLLPPAKSPWTLPAQQERNDNGKGRGMNAFYAAAITIGLLGCQTTGERPVKLQSKQDSLSYSIGVNVGKSLKRDSIGISPEAFLRGVMDARSDSSQWLMPEKEVQQTIMSFQAEMRAKQVEASKALGEKNLKEGEAFLAQNAKKPGVVTTASGLQYRVITPGKGKMPKANATVTTNYRGRLLDGTEFDSSYKRGQPATFPLNGVIKGWTEALQMMKVGSKWELYVPPSLGYGEGGAGNVIPPNATLIFELELLSVK